MQSSLSVKPKAIHVFFSYAFQSVEDKLLQQELEKQLSVLKEQGLIVNWHQSDIQAGQEWEHEIAARINSADIILLLVSPDFIASDYCYNVEMKYAMQRHEQGEARVVPVLLRSTSWKDAPFGKLQPLPKNGKPVTSWADRDEALLDITIGIQDIVNALSQPKSYLTSESNTPYKGIENFSELLERLRKEHQISKKDLAASARLTPGYISLLTRGESHPSRETINILADALQLDSKNRQNLLEAGGFHFPAPTNQRKTGCDRADWGDAPLVKHFYGRQEDLAKLEQWIVHDHCQVIAILGIGGIGKTSLATKQAEQLSDGFDYIYWRSLQNYPSVDNVLTNCLQFFSNQQQEDLPKDIDSQKSLLLSYLRNYRCLIVLDNVESIIQEGQHIGSYREGYEGYGQLFRLIGEAKHRSCLLLTSREKPKEIARLEGNISLVRSIRLHGLGQSETQEILKDKDVFGSEEALNELISLYSGNPLALKLVSEGIREVFGGNLVEFLKKKELIFGDLHDSLDQQFHRLSQPEKDILYWLAIERGPVSLEALEADLMPPMLGKDLLAAIGSLRRRSIIESSSSVHFALQPVIMEYVISEFVEHLYKEIDTGMIRLLASHSIVKPGAKDLVKHSQVSLILKPIATRLLISYGRIEAEKKLKDILSTMQGVHALKVGYAANNIHDLLTQLYQDSAQDLPPSDLIRLPEMPRPP